ncbi:unnamed protein product, partial [Staurois parvus]
GHRWVALVGTGGWHCWTQVGGISGHRWWHCRVAQVGALCTAGHRWVHCWAQVGGARTAGHRWAELATAGLWALIISALMIGADPRSDNCRSSAVLSSRSDSVRKVQPRTGTC